MQIELLANYALLSCIFELLYVYAGSHTLQGAARTMEEANIFLLSCSIGRWTMRTSQKQIPFLFSAGNSLADSPTLQLLPLVNHSFLSNHETVGTSAEWTNAFRLTLFTLSFCLFLSESFPYSSERFSKFTF